MDREINRRTLLAAIPSLGIAACADAKANSTGPLFVLIEQDPWATVPGADAPTFALYGDGTVIFRRGEGYSSVKLGRHELARLTAELNLTALPAFAKHYETASFTDARTEVLFVFREDKPSVISVYGPLTVAGAGAQVPAKVVSAYDRVRAFDHPKARPWLPDKIEVMIWPYDYAPEPSIVWPKEWPGLNDTHTVRRGGDAYSIYLSSTEYPELQRFLATQREKGAVEIGGRKWAASTRVPFPSERSWMAHTPAVKS
jgi:hypothetical protein